ncbi:MAG: hypothetical protein HY840_11200 [Bacteroidetes bacterium]|nr:hypothetical protein [Bacteroidota bacterium]
MAKKWSEKTEKLTLVSNDELLIIDSEDANTATKNKRVKAGLLTGGYKKYVALLTQAGTAAPTAIVLENTVGNIVWTRLSAGAYYGTLTGMFTLNKTLVLCTANPAGSNMIQAKAVDADRIIVGTVLSTNGTATDGFMTNTSIEIRVYA